MIIALLAAAATAPQAITAPAWLTRPSSQEIGAAYPAQALRQRIDGQAMITCVVNVRGLLEACIVASESPPGEGFGAAALALAPSFSMTPAMGPGGPRSAKINIPIRWQIGPTPNGASTPAAGSSTHAQWIRAPRSADMVWPGVAWYGHISGHVVLDCVIASNTKLKPCAVVEDTPKGRGFADAAIAFLEPAKMRPPTVDGAPIPDAHVQVTVDYDGAQRGVRFAWLSQ